MKKIKKTAKKKLSPGAATEIAYKKAQTAVLEKVADGSLLEELLASLAETLGDTAFAKEMRDQALDRVKKAATESPSNNYSHIGSRLLV